MATNDPQSHRPVSAAIADQAALWLARRDRGLTSTEQDDYMQWLAADPRHGEAMTQHAAAFERMMHLYEWQPVHTAEPNPDLFAPRGASRWWIRAAGLTAVAAAVMIGLVALRPSAPVAPAKSYLRVNDRLALPDGSRVELKDGSKVVVQYSGTERRVKLTGGEAQFSVWKDANRPFVVEAAGVEVRAVGTVFNVRLQRHTVEVLVMEGRVKVDRETGTGSGAPAAVKDLLVAAGEETAVPLAAAAAVPVVARATPEEIHQSLAWQAPRLQFFETPLAEAVAEFNRLNRHQIIVGDPELRELSIGGTFRPDNVEGFVRLLSTTLDLRAEKDGEGQTVLRRAR